MSWSNQKYLSLSEKGITFFVRFAKVVVKLIKTKQIFQ